MEITIQITVLLAPMDVPLAEWEQPLSSVLHAGLLEVFSIISQERLA